MCVWLALPDTRDVNLERYLSARANYLKTILWHLHCLLLKFMFGLSILKVHDFLTHLELSALQTLFELKLYSSITSSTLRASLIRFDISSTY